MMKNLLTLFFLTVMISSTFADITDGLVVYLKLDGDSVATVGPKVYSPVALFPATDNWGNQGGALAYTGETNGFLYMMASEVVNLPLDSSARTLACWVLVPPSGNDKHMISYGMNGGNANAGKHCHIKINSDSTLGMNFWNYDFKSPKIGEAEDFDIDFVNLRDSAWHHIAVTYNEAYEVALYIDGVPVPVADTMGNGIGQISNINTQLQATNAYLAFGTQNVFWPQPGFIGALDEVRIYNRALSEDDIADLYAFAPEVISASSILAGQSISYYPNPATDKVVFSETSNVRLYNIAGKLILDQQGVNSIDVSTIANGLYLIQINNQVSKLIVK